MAESDAEAARAAAIADFLRAHGWGAARRVRLADDASFRRYERLYGMRDRAVLMDAPPPHEDVRPFVAMSAILNHLGLSAPHVRAHDAGRGVVLLEDLGDDRLAERVDGAGADLDGLYALATDTLIALHDAWDTAEALPAPAPPAYDTAKLVEGEAMLFADWYAPAVGVRLDAAARDAWAEAWRSALTPALALPHTLTLRDYFPDNLMYRPDRPGVRACGLLDFQDAVIGPCAYDLMSLLQDARRDVPAQIEETMLRRYLDARPGIDPEALRTGYAVLAAQRHAKVIGIFTRLAHRDGKPAYLRHIPRLWRMLETSLAEPALAPVKTWLDTHLPAHRRVVPEAEVPA